LYNYKNREFEKLGVLGEVGLGRLEV